MENRDNRLAYQGKIEALLKEWGSQIDTWQTALPGNTQAYINDLNSKRQAVRSKLAELKDSAEDRWKDFRFEMDQAVEEMKQAVDAIRARMETH